MGSQMQEQNKSGRRSRLPLALLIVAVLAIAGVALYRSGILDKINSVEELQALIASAGSMADVVYFLLQMMTVIVAPIPSNVSMMAGALALGFWRAMILGVLAVVAGSVIMFLLVRKLGQNAVQRFVDKGMMDKYLPVIEEKQDMFLFLTMLFPFFPDDAICMLAGLSSISLGRFLVIMAIGRPWGLIFAALLGSGNIHMPMWGWVISGVLMLAVFIYCMKNSAKIEAKLFDFARRVSPARKKGKKGEDKGAGK